MKRILFGIVACGACLMLATGCSSEDKEPTLPKFEMSPAEKVIAQKQTSKQAEMLADVVSSQKNFSNDGSNLIFSPLNVSMALSVLANATDDNTAAVLTDLVGCSDLDDLNKFNARLIEYLPVQPKNNILELANGVWYNNDLEIVPSFVNVTSSFYDCMPNKMDFGAPDACKVINNWISDRTHGLINDFVNELTINSMTQMFIASTLYYRGTWLSPFDSKNTADKVFHGSKGDAQIPTMYKSTSMDYAETADGTQVVELPFKSENIVFSVLLPAEGVDVMDYASGFDSQKLQEIESSIASREVNLHLPKFTVTDNLMLDQYLLDKGIDIDRFSVERACSRVNLSLNVKHQTHFEIDEEGVKLAAVTGEIMVGAPEPKIPVEFNVDRPFIFFVKEKSTGSILMAGIIRNITK